jgi:ferredoxin
MDRSVMKLAFSNSLTGSPDPSLKAYDRPMALEVEIDRDVCMGSGNCVYVASGVFQLDEDSIAHVVDPGASTEDSVVTAARQCPTHAITVRRDGETLV